MEKEKLGFFVARVRKEKGMTQKELAEKLNITDKAISKWERGLSYPDISMLEPLAESLEVSVLELLQGERIQKEESISIDRAEEIFQQSLAISDTEISEKSRRSKRVILAACVVVMFLFSLFLNVSNYVREIQKENAETIISKDSEHYQTITTENGDTVFENPKEALAQMIEDCSHRSKDEDLAAYLKILIRSLKEGEK